MRAAFLFICVIAFLSATAQSPKSREHYAGEVLHFSEKLKKDPDNISDIYARASFHQILCQFPAARQDYQKVLELYARNPKKYAAIATDACYFLADDYYFRNSDRGNAQIYIEKGLSITPDDKRFEVLKTGILGTYPEKEAEAQKEFESLLSKYPKDEKIAQYYAKFLERKDIERAMKLYEQVIAINPDNIDALFALGAYYINEASRIYKEASDPGKVLTYTTKSVGYFERVHLLNPGDKEIVQILVQIYSNLNRFKDMEKMERKLK